MSYGHDLARELRAVGFNLDKRAQAIGVSSDWVAVAQDRDVGRRVVAEGSCSCLDNEGGTPSIRRGTALYECQCQQWSLDVYDCGVHNRCEYPSSSQSSLAAADQQPPIACCSDPVGGVTLIRIDLDLDLVIVRYINY